MKKNKTNNYNDKVSEIIAEYKLYKNELGEIFDELYGEKDISNYKLELFLKKVELITCKVIKLNDKFNLLNNKEWKNLMISSLLIAIYNIILFSTFIGNELIVLDKFISLILTLIGIKWSISNLKRLNVITNKKEEKIINENNNEILIIAKNCTTRIRKRIKDKKQKLTNEQPTSNKSLIDISIADIVIREYIENGNLIFTPPEIITLVTKILQDDLNTNESDMKKLLNMAKSNINEMSNKIKDIKELEKIK